MGSTIGQYLVKNALIFKKTKNLQEIRLSYMLEAPETSEFLI